MKAIDNAYHALLPKNGHPLVVLNITVPAGMVDINVHPRKSEVKFSDDKIIFKAVYHGILNALNNPLHERYERESSAYMGESFSKDSTNTNNTSINKEMTILIYLMAIVRMILIEYLLLFTTICNLQNI